MMELAASGSVEMMVFLTRDCGKMKAHLVSDLDVKMGSLASSCDVKKARQKQIFSRYGVMVEQAHWLYENLPLHRHILRELC